jgi:hypothetical protein
MLTRVSLARDHWADAAQTSAAAQVIVLAIVRFIPFPFFIKSQPHSDTMGLECWHKMTA